MENVPRMIARAGCDTLNCLQPLHKQKQSPTAVTVRDGTPQGASHIIPPQGLSNVRTIRSIPRPDRDRALCRCNQESLLFIAGDDMKENTIPAEALKPCDCCGRVHRKLYNVQGYWMGKTCADGYRIYQRSDAKEITSIFWRGHEKQYHNIKRMIGSPS